MGEMQSCYIPNLQVGALCMPDVEKGRCPSSIQSAAAGVSLGGGCLCLWWFVHLLGKQNALSAKLPALLSSLLQLCCALLAQILYFYEFLSTCTWLGVLRNSSFYYYCFFNERQVARQRSNGSLSILWARVRQKPKIQLTSHTWME